MTDTPKPNTISETWNLDGLFKGLDDPELKQAMDELQSKIDRAEELLASEDGPAYIEQALLYQEEVYLLAVRILGFLSLSSSADTRNTQVLGLMQRVRRMLTPFSKVETRVKEEIKKIDDLDAYLNDHPAIADYSYLLSRAQSEAEHTFSQDVEEMIDLMNLSAGSSWSQLVILLTSTLEVDWPTDEDSTNKVNLSTIRNLANDPDPEIRRRAYEAELAAYPQITASVAAALNAIKTQVSMLAEKRGYDSALDMAADESHMTRETLDVLIGVMEAKRPILHRYMKAKARVLGHESAQLPWWDIIAPVGKNETSYTIEEARDLLVEVFEPLSAEITNVIARSFDEAWIDVYPRAGKVGGAFCSFQPTLKESRMLTNFNGSFDALSTLAHELGHAYHGDTIKDHRPLNQNYSMPVAETASTFNETHLTLHMYKEAVSPEEKLAILDNYLTGAGQTVVDILSRFTFEKEVFERSKETYLNV